MNVGDFNGSLLLDEAAPYSAASLSNDSRCDCSGLSTMECEVESDIFRHQRWLRLSTFFFLTVAGTNLLEGDIQLRGPGSIRLPSVTVSDEPTRVRSEKHTLVLKNTHIRTGWMLTGEVFQGVLEGRKTGETILARLKFKSITYTGGRPLTVSDEEEQGQTKEDTVQEMEEAELTPDAPDLEIQLDKGTEEIHTEEADSQPQVDEREPLELIEEEEALPSIADMGLGSTAGIHISADESVITADPGFGIGKFKIEFRVIYKVPAFPRADDYSGVANFIIQ